MHKHQDKKWLEEQYIKKRRSLRDMGFECGVGHATIHKWLRRFGIPTRTLEEAMKSRQRLTIEEAIEEVLVLLGDEEELPVPKVKKKKRPVKSNRPVLINHSWAVGDVEEQMNDIQDRYDYID